MSAPLVFNRVLIHTLLLKIYPAGCLKQEHPQEYALSVSLRKKSHNCCGVFALILITSPPRILPAMHSINFIMFLHKKFIQNKAGKPGFLQHFPHL